jgi:hypothetical protein
VPTPHVRRLLLRLGRLQRRVIGLRAHAWAAPGYLGGVVGHGHERREIAEEQFGFPVSSLE